LNNGLKTMFNKPLKGGSHECLSSSEYIGWT
jgi:hypothetical protein